MQVKTEIQVLEFNSNCVSSRKLKGFIFLNETIKNLIFNAYAVPMEIYRTGNLTFQKVYVKRQII